MKGNSALVKLSIIIMILVTVASFVLSVFIVLLIPLAITALISAIFVSVYQIYCYYYFKSNKFLLIRSTIQKYVDNCNELNNHINDLKSSYINISSYDYGNGELNDKSKFNFKRKEWQKNTHNHQVHYCSASICKNASNQPMKYLCKYFNITSDESSLINFESVLNDFAAAQQGKELLWNERDSILNSIRNSVPRLILKFSKDKVIRKLGFEAYDFSDLYFPVYTFQYVSAGGNSSFKFDIQLNIENLETLIFYLNDLVKFRNSIKGQRALMTSELREKIKNRDNYCCKKCSISISDEKNLLLEIDHIIPLSKGGVTTEENLQTLCWRCNRTKGSKMEFSNFN
ncbi:HNH endonuclease [Aquirufa nivalisilvae]|uniref:HNH endonuclease n=1 Tax=Aquirufa nivalisilvae TaxID=2516557 RepID=UPI0022A92F62|nr:HNH endonuclease signature motif containing protein [Aquirufa nivalisilvae]MCZ2483911.1 HNH endonuclease [Aquirufa nivalisilvae]